MSVNSRISIFFESLKIEKKAFAQKISIAPTSLQNVLSNSSEPNSKILVKILEAYPMLSAEWLLRNIEPMLLNLESSPESFAESKAPYNTTLNKSTLKIDVIESERQLYERVIRAKDDIIEVLKQQLNNLQKGE